MTSHTATVRRDTPVPGTHLTELELTEMWYQDHERLTAALGNESHYRAHGRLFPRSRTDLIQYYTRLSLSDLEQAT